MFKILALYFTVVLLIFVGSEASSARETSYQTEVDIPYYDKDTRSVDTYIESRCKLDVYYPKGRTGFSTLVWFHGGGLKGGHKRIPPALMRKGIAVVAVNYRLHPKVSAPSYIEDSAAAVAWVFNNIEKFGGDSARIFISGHSAGGYLASMVGIDKTWLAKHAIDANKLAGIIPLSGHTITHFTVRKEQGIPLTRPTIDELAPLYHVRHDAAPLLLITGDREKELFGRTEENAYMMRMMKEAGHKDSTHYELQGYGHGMTEPAFPLLLKEIQRVIKTYHK